ncbi:MAG: general secretion pathway protein GspK [Sedimentisphaerales bacterium]|nr:general secretion pathway protein GspK [Sedimentisphaerales bacterium]
MKKNSNNSNINKSRTGIVLLLTLVILAVIAMLGYTLTSRVMSDRLRNQYLIDYSQARYGCDSALKYAMATMENIDPVLVSRSEYPDFSDLFALDAEQYREFIEQWERTSGDDGSEEVSYFSSRDLFKADTNDTDIEDAGSIIIPGPYGAAWPFIAEPVEIEIGTAKVRIEIEDENAKYPLGWSMVEDKDLQWELDTGFETFCEMSGMEYEEIESLKSDLAEIGKIKPYKIDFKPVVTTTREPVKTSSKTSSSKTKTPATQIKRTVLTVATQISNQTTSFARFFNSTLLDRDALARPTIIDGDRKESPLKYISTWGTRLININSAPRHVLEAAFIFNGDQVEIADQIIKLRQTQPFEDLDDLQKRVVGYKDSIEKSQSYITTKSNIFTIRITATSGTAKAFAIIAVKKEANTTKRIAVIND